jgi:hypothetical protein
MKVVLLVVLAGLMICLGTASASEQTESAYVPGMGEIMATTQMRHAKLWLAGQARNWELADYELDEIKEGFEDAVKYHPIFKGVPVSGMLDKFTSSALNELDHAVHQKNGAQFEKSFDDLTIACNSCHVAAGHGYIVIKRPVSRLQYSNQKFER